MLSIFIIWYNLDKVDTWNKHESFIISIQIYLYSIFQNTQCFSGFKENHDINAYILISD